MLVNLTVKVFEDIENYFLYTGFLLQKFTHRMDCDLCCTFFRKVEFSGGNTAESHTVNQQLYPHMTEVACFRTL